MDTSQREKQTVLEPEGETCDAADGQQTCEQMTPQGDETCDAADGHQTCEQMTPQEDETCGAADGHQTS